MAHREGRPGEVAGARSKCATTTTNDEDSAGFKFNPPDVSQVPIVGARRVTDSD